MKRKQKQWVVYDQAIRQIHSGAPSRQKAHEFANVWNTQVSIPRKFSWYGRRFIAAKIVFEAI